MQQFSPANPVSLPVVQQSAARVTRTHCPYCAFQCGMTITTSGDEEPQIRPDEHFPVNQGQMCVKGFTSGELVRHPARLMTPLIRGADGRLVSATWEAALDLVAERLLRLKAVHGPEALAAFGSGSLTNEKAYLLGKFVRLALGSPYVDYNGRYCMASAAAGQNLAFGIDRGLPFPVSHIAQARTVLLWGSNLADTLPPIMQYFERQRQSNGRLIVVDPRLTDTARAAHVHLQLTPGSDLALANGLLYLAIEEKLIDQAYIEQRTAGFGAVRRAVSTYPPTRVERLTGVSVERMRTAVRLLAAESSMLLSGRGPEQQSKGTDTVLAFTNLMLALGKVGKPFSGYGCLTGQGNGQGGREHGQKADQLPGYRLIENEEHRREVAARWKIDPATLPRKGKSATELIDSFGAERGVRALLVFGSNLAVAAPGSLGVAEKLARLELLVVCDSFLNETCESAQVVLPTMQWFEEEGTMTTLEGRVILRRRAVAPPDGARSDIEILRQLARRLGRGELFEFARDRDVFEELRRVTAGAPADYSGISYEKIEKNDGVFWPCPSEGHPGTPVLFTERFAHPDGRARFVVVEHRPAAEEPDADYPVYFTTGRLKEHYNSGVQTRLVAPLLAARPEPRVQMHPRLARRYGLSDGDNVTVESRRGRVVFGVSLTTDIRPDTLFAPFHWGKKQGANILTNPALDPISRMPEFKVCAVRLVPQKRTGGDRA